MTTRRTTEKDEARRGGDEAVGTDAATAGSKPAREGEERRAGAEVMEPMRWHGSGVCGDHQTD